MGWIIEQRKQPGWLLLRCVRMCDTAVLLSPLVLRSLLLAAPPAPTTATLFVLLRVTNYSLDCRVRSSALRT